MPRSATIGGLPEAFAVIKEMQGQDYDWGEDYRATGRATVCVAGHDARNWPEINSKLTRN